MFRSLIITVLTLIGLAFVFGGVADADSPEFVGAQKCGMCHMDESDDWAKSSHGKAFDSLLASKRTKAQNKALSKIGLDPKKDYDKVDECLSCHTTGFGKPGGYLKADPSSGVKGVGCESCHGAGSLYSVIHEEKPESFTKAETAKAGQVNVIDEKVCRRCHDVEESVFSSGTDKKYGFDFKSRIEQKKTWHKKYELFFTH